MLGRFKMLCLATAISLATACGGGSSSSSVTPPNPQPPVTAPEQASNEYQYLCASVEQQKSPACAGKQAQSIAPVLVNTLVTQNYYDLTRQSSADLTTTIRSLSPQVCTVQNNVIQTLTEGSCSLEFSQAGNQLYQPAATLVSTIPVYKVENLPVANLSQCQSGSLAQAYKNSALNTLNDIRALHGLAPVGYDAHYDDEMMQTALLNLANENLSHYPTTNMKCYSDVAKAGAGSSNLEVNFHSNGPIIDARDPMINALTERFSNNLGHRRWLLSPFLTRISFGAIMNTAPNINNLYVTGYATKVIFPEDLFKATSKSLGLIAYPYENYPSRYYEKGVPLSLSILVDQSASWKNEVVDFSQAHVTVTERGSSTLQSISNIQFDNVGQGLPNSLQFNFDTLEYNRFYDVSVSNVKVNGELKNYSYWFRVLD